ncbi:MAG: hypothetical protein WC910_04865 [Bacteroidales bacterium]|jgi:hypothetical protein
MKFLRKFLFRLLLPVGCLMFLFVPGNVYGMNSRPLQKLSLGSQWSPSRSALDPSTGLLYFMQEQTLTVVDLGAFRILGQFEQSEPEPGMSFDDYHPVVMQSVLYLVKDRGGSLLKWENGSWIRLDNASENNMQAGSTVFAREGRIYRYGGYGFWSCRNFFTYYNPGIRSWEILAPVNTDKLPQGTSGTDMIDLHEQTYFLRGEKVIPSNPMRKEPFRECWEFTWKNKSWRYLGIHRNMFAPSAFHFRWNDKLVYVSDGLTYVYDFPHNRFTSHENTSPVWYCKAGMYHYRDHFYILGESPGNMDISIFRVNENDLLGEKTGEGRIYINGFHRTLWIVTGLFLLMMLHLLFLMGRCCVYSHKVGITGNKIQYKNKKIELKPMELNILELLLNKNELSTADLMDGLNKDQLHPTQRMRILASVIEEINLKLRFVTGSDTDFIKIRKREIDKRIKAYYIEKKWFDHIPRD